MYAIVGGGLAGFTTYATLRHAGIEAAEIAVFDNDPDPVARWRPRVAAIRQTEMRSESDGHCSARSFPGLAVREARRRRTVGPLLRSVCDRYRPSVVEFLDHVEELRARTSWDASFQPFEISRVAAVPGGFELDGRGVFQHVVLATGHPGLALPHGVLGDRRAVHAYEPHDYTGSVAIVGAGMAAATEWRNALASGANVVSIRRREPLRRPLNVERQFFAKRGLRMFHRAEPDWRAELLASFSAPSYPPGRAWDEPIERATAEGRFRVASDWRETEQVICATGFKRGYREDQLLRRLVDDHGLDTVERWVVLEPDAGVGRLCDASRTLAIAGVAAQWAYPAADTLAGMKYVARRFLARSRRCRTR